MSRFFQRDKRVNGEPFNVGKAALSYLKQRVEISALQDELEAQREFAAFWHAVFWPAECEAAKARLEKLTPVHDPVTGRFIKKTQGQ